MLDIRNLSLTLGDFQLQDISLDIKKGSFHVIAGHTGSGKTLLLECILGLRSVGKNKIFLEGEDCYYIPVENRNMAYVPQDFAIFPHLSVEQNILYSLSIQKDKGLQDLSLINELIDITGIRPLLDRKPKHLSGGEKQRIAFVRALVAGNKILVLDEPLSSLNKTLKYELQQLLLRLHTKYNLTIIMVTHDLEEAYTLAEYISVIHNGSILQTSTQDELYRHPQSEEVAHFLGISNIFDAEVESIKDNTLLLNVPDLGVSLIANSRNSLTKGTKIKIGIRNDEVMILRKNMQKKDQTNLLEVKVISLLQKGATQLVTAMTGFSNTLVYIEVPAYAFGKLNMAVDDKIRITLREEMIFIINN